MNGPIYQIASDELERTIGRIVRAAVSEVTTQREIMTKAEAAEYLRVSISTINYYMKKDLPIESIGGESPRFRKTSLDRWLRANPRVLKEAA